MTSPETRIRNRTAASVVAIGLLAGACAEAIVEPTNPKPPTDAVGAAQNPPDAEVPSGTPGVPAIKVWHIETGDGPMARNGDWVEMHYVGTFLDGKEFDSSRDGGKPIKFLLGTGGVIQGWDLVGAQMRVGDRWKVEIPWQLAYGARGRRGIPPRTNLVFDMEFLDTTPR